MVLCRDSTRQAICSPLDCPSTDDCGTDRPGSVTDTKITSLSLHSLTFAVTRCPLQPHVDTCFQTHLALRTRQTDHNHLAQSLLPPKSIRARSPFLFIFIFRPSPSCSLASLSPPSSRCLSSASTTQNPRQPPPAPLPLHPPPPSTRPRAPTHSPPAPSSPPRRTTPSRCANPRSSCASPSPRRRPICPRRARISSPPRTRAGTSCGSAPSTWPSISTAPSSPAFAGAPCSSWAPATPSRPSSPPSAAPTPSTCRTTTQRSSTTSPPPTCAPTSPAASTSSSSSRARGPGSRPCSGGSTPSSCPAIPSMRRTRSNSLQSASWPCCRSAASPSWPARPTILALGAARESLRSASRRWLRRLMACAWRSTLSRRLGTDAATCARS
ncbi:unnamed protein product [Chondrus crispus]|uniref:Uncharacterized protein n=1 Tax=Chondrus crispus TaxID=2769 RepID=R7QAA3_CHOCR|nr:unnamed protein product [Chondrus crispus]CDF35447.1 unnamed protein product [Chondrus crispus]|eukprot:XP_005715266.1 unnamed protein product [Chondrus crispus]